MDNSLDVTPTLFSRDSLHRASEKYEELRLRLPHDALKEINQVLSHFPIDPRTAMPDEAWKVIWDKPLYSNTKVQVAKRWISEIDPFMAKAWTTWGESDQIFKIAKVKNGRNADAFNKSGSDLEKLCGVSGVALHRLYAIQNSAAALRSFVKISETPVAQFWDVQLEIIVPKLVKIFGWGWGATTVFHMLTDFGIASKPDIHVIRALRHLGVWLGTDDTVSLRAGLEINKVIRALVTQSGEFTPSRLRRFDIELMSISRFGLTKQ